MIEEAQEPKSTVASSAEEQRSSLPLDWAMKLLLGGGLLITNPAIADAKPLPPPTIFDNLPPSQPSTPSLSAPVQVPSGPPNQVSPSRNLEFDATPPGTTTPLRNVSTEHMYEVDVFGDNPLLLEQVQRIVPDAFIRHREGVIQAGVFVEKSYADERVRLLAAQGIRAQMKTVAARVSDSPTLGSSSPAVTGYSPTASNVPTVTEDALKMGNNLPIATGNAPRVSNNFSMVTGEPPRASSAITSEPPTIARSSDLLATSYFVVIPGGRENLDDLASRLVRLGLNRENVREKEQPRGPHLAVGPFEERGLAERWSSYLRSAGMDARVYYGTQ